MKSVGRENSMKKFAAALLVLTMVLALASTAMAATKFAKDDWVVLKKNSTAYTAAKSSKATKNVAEKGSVAKVVKERGKFVKVIVNKKAGTTVYFKKSNLVPYTDKKDPYILVFWAKGGRGMSSDIDWIDDYMPEMTKVKITGRTNLRKTPGLESKSQGVVKKGDVLKFKGKMGYDDRGVGWFKVSKNGKILWVSSHFCTMPYCKKKK